ncbi:MAG: hypothetical protein FJ358_08165 [Thaumarchaeota archaeon]|nr:hypothetical protein [Nitrososphaerota archaeon]
MPKARLESEGSYERWLSQVAKFSNRFSPYKIPRTKEHGIRKRPKPEHEATIRYECKPCDLTFQNLDLYEIHNALKHKAG